MRDYAEVRRQLLRDLEPYLNGNPFMSSDMSGQQVSALALADSFYKKLCPDDNTEKADKAALEKFLRINASVSTCPFDFQATSEQESTFWDYFKNNFQSALEWEVEGTNYDLSFIRESIRVGPGAAQKAVNTDFMSKLFEGPVSYTSEFLIPLYRSAIADTGLWCEAEAYRTQRFPFVKVEGGKIFFAKKNAEISRTCCTPANLNLLVQMSVGMFIETRLRERFGISLSTQPDKNRELARLGSIDGSFGTIDLVSASDTVSWQLCLRLLEENFLKRVIRECRDERAVLPDGSEIALNMISTMGNGFTFPLQTLIFACAVKSAYEMMGLRPSAAATCHPSSTSFGVFGDDIVVHKSAYSFVVKVLTKLGFEVNDAKSFNSGLFRESCGSDYFGGRNVRGVYIQSLETPQQVYSAINRLLRWSAASGILLPRVIGYLGGLVRPVLVPPSSADDSGIRVPFRATRPSVNARYWFRYRYYRRVGSSIDVLYDADTGNGWVDQSNLGYSTGTSGQWQPARPFTTTNLELRARKASQPTESEAWDNVVVDRTRVAAIGRASRGNPVGASTLERDARRRKSPSGQYQARSGEASRSQTSKVTPESGSANVLLNPFGVGVGHLGGFIRRSDLSLTDENLDHYLMGNVERISTFSRRERRGARIRYQLTDGDIPYWDFPGHADPFNCKSQEMRIEVHKVWEDCVMASLCVSSG